MKTILQKYLVGILLLVSITNSQAQHQCFKLPIALEEVSGLYIKHANEFWWITDSGTPAQLFATDHKGHIKEQINIPAKNVDWEDLTIDELGNFYIGDFGNNANKRKDLKIYIYNPYAKQLDSISFHYPDQQLFPPEKPQWNFDAEAFFWFQDSLHIFSKNRLHEGNYYTKHYVVPAKAGDYTAELRDSIYLEDRVVTGAAISDDGTRVALLAYTYKKLLGFFPSSKASVFIIQDYEGSQFSKGAIYKIAVPPYIIATQYESIDFYGRDILYVASEQTAFIKPRARQLKLKKKHFDNRKRIDSNQ